MYRPKQLDSLRNGVIRLAPMALLVATLGMSGCERSSTAAPTASGGDPHRGAVLITQFGCGACHLIPGISGADGLVGPPLSGIAKRITLAGVLPNTPENMLTWLKTPQAVVPGNAMPNMGLTDEDAKNIAAYLRTLR